MDNMNSSLNELEGIKPIRNALRSGLIERCEKARSKKLKDLLASDLRVLVSQRISLVNTIPLALDILDKDSLIEADLYRGDLLEAVLSVPKDYWLENENVKYRFLEIQNEAHEVFLTLQDIIIPKIFLEKMV